MRYYRSSKKAGTSQKRKAWSKSRSNPAKNSRVRHYEEAAFLGASNLYKHHHTKPLHLKSIILGIVIIVWLNFLTFSPFFRITSATYSGNSLISTEQIKEIINQKIIPKNSFLPTNHYFFINSSKIEEELIEKLPIESAKVNKNFPESLSVVIVEKNSSIIYDNGEAFYLLDHQGKLLKYLKQVELPKIADFTTNTSSSTLSTSTLRTNEVLHEPNGNEFSEEYPNLPIYYSNDLKRIEKEYSSVDPKIISGIIDFDRGIRQGNEVKIKYFLSDLNNIDVIAITNQNWQIKFTVDRSIDTQLIAFRNIFKASQPTEYIDVRLEDRLFWK